MKLAAPSRLVPVLGTVAPLFIYLGVAFFCLGTHVSWTKFYFGTTADCLLFIWCLHWWPFAISHGLNPFLCKYVWFPEGYNFAWNTSIPLFALLMWPVTMLGSPALSFNILAVAMPAVSSWAAFLLGRELTRDWAASLVCGFLFGFSTPELMQAGELNVGYVFLAPLAVLLCLRRVKGKLSRRRFVILFALLMAAQLGISTEMLALLCIGGTLAWAVFLLFAPKPERSTIARLALDAALAAPLTMLLTTPLLYYLVLGLPEVPSIGIHPLFVQVADALNLLVPAPHVHSLWDALTAIAGEFRGYRPGYSTYLSIPLLIMLLLYASRHMRVPYMRALLCLLGLFTLLGMGPRLQFNGAITALPLPSEVFSHIPVIRTLVTPRFLFYVELGLALISAFWLAEGKTPRARTLRFGLAIVACICLLPAKVRVAEESWQTHKLFPPAGVLYWTRWPEHPFFTPGHIRAALGPMPNVLILPDPVTSPAMAWQIDSGMGFTQATGYIGFRLANQLRWKGMDDLTWGRLMPNFTHFFPAFCAAHKVDYVLIAPGTPVNIVAAIERLGWPHRTDMGIEIVTPPRS